MEVPGQCQEQPVQTLIVCLLQTHLFGLIQSLGEGHLRLRQNETELVANPVLDADKGDEGKEVVVKVPWSWKRRVENNATVIYTSPCGVSIQNVEDVRTYLLRDGTCKCGLECPLDISTYFNFQPKAKPVPAPVRLTPPAGVNPGLYCCHRQKTYHMAAQEELTGMKIQHVDPRRSGH